MLEITLIPRDEAWLHSGEVAVPLEIVFSENTVEIQYYPSAKPIVDELLEKFGASVDSLFSADAASWACVHFGDFLGQYGFELSPDSESVYLNYTLRGLGGEVPEFVRRIDGNEGYNDLTDTDIEGLADAGYIIYAAVVGNDIVALANTGVPIDKDTEKLVEIGVDTAGNYRRQGYGRACVTVLVNELSKMGYTAVYECAENNIASVGLVKSLGGELAFQKFYIVGFKD